jgi:hypothetical protein
MSAEPAMKKQKVSKSTITLVDNFHMRDCQLQSLGKSSKCNLATLTKAGDEHSPVLVQLNGGGVIPLSFGIDDKEQDGRRKVQIALQIDSISDHEHLERLRGELGEMVAEQWKKWFPDTTPPSKDVLMNFCNNFVSPRKKKKTGDGTWSGVSKATIDPEECNTGRCKIVDKDTGDIIPFHLLPGMTWHKVVFEFRYVFVQATKSYGVTKKLRYILCTAKEDDGEIEPL